MAHTKLVPVRLTVVAQEDIDAFVAGAPALERREIRVRRLAHEAFDQGGVLSQADRFEVVVHDRNVANREKKVDVGIATMLLDDSHEYMRPGQDMAVLVAGERDYVPRWNR